MRMIFLKTLATTVVVFLIAMSSCIDCPWENRVTRVVDYKENCTDFDLEYDDRCRLIRYGDTPITYGVNKVSIGPMLESDCCSPMLYADFQFRDNHLYRSEAHIRMLAGSVEVEACKRTDYSWRGDTLVMLSEYSDTASDSLLCRGKSCYIYDANGRLVEALTSTVDAAGQESACHSYFSYETSLSYDANLNIQAYFADRKDLDTFFYFLLDMGGRTRSCDLPNRIRHCVNHGKATYIAESLFKLDGDRPVRMEIISTDVKLKARYDFFY